MTSETVLVCGGAGYVGSALVFRLLKETDFKIKVFDNLSYGGDSLFSFFNFPERFEFVKGDVRTFDFDQLLKGVDYVVNLTALVGEPICKKFPKEAKVENTEYQKAEGFPSPPAAASGAQPPVLPPPPTADQLAQAKAAATVAPQPVLPAAPAPAAPPVDQSVTGPADQAAPAKVAAEVKTEAAAPEAAAAPAAPEAEVKAAAASGPPVDQLAAKVAAAPEAEVKAAAASGPTAPPPVDQSPADQSAAPTATVPADQSAAPEAAATDLTLEAAQKVGEAQVEAESKKVGEAQVKESKKVYLLFTDEQNGFTFKQGDAVVWLGRSQGKIDTIEGSDYKVRSINGVFTPLSSSKLIGLPHRTYYPGEKVITTKQLHSIAPVEFVEATVIGGPYYDNYYNVKDENSNEQFRKYLRSKKDDEKLETLPFSSQTCEDIQQQIKIEVESLEFINGWKFHENEMVTDIDSGMDATITKINADNYDIETSLGKKKAPSTQLLGKPKKNTFLKKKS